MLALSRETCLALARTALVVVIDTNKCQATLPRGQRQEIRWAKRGSEVLLRSMVEHKNTQIMVAKTTTLRGIRSILTSDRSIKRSSMDGTSHQLLVRMPTTRLLGQLLTMPWISKTCTEEKAVGLGITSKRCLRVIEWCIKEDLDLEVQVVIYRTGECRLGWQLSIVLVVQVLAKYRVTCTQSNSQTRD